MISQTLFLLSIRLSSKEANVWQISNDFVKELHFYFLESPFSHFMVHSYTNSEWNNIKYNTETFQVQTTKINATNKNLQNNTLKINTCNLLCKMSKYF
jgi:hypothetical protein